MLFYWALGQFKTEIPMRYIFTKIHSVTDKQGV